MVEDPEFLKEWRRAGDVHIAACERLDAVHAEKTGNDEYSEALRNWWDSVAVLLHMYTRRANWPSGELSPPMVTLPWVLVAVLADTAFSFAEGSIPADVKGVIRRGAPGNRPGEIQDRGVAVRYILEAEAGRINDPDARKTVCDKFGVKLRTVQDWVSELSAGAERADFWAKGNLDDAFRAAAARYRHASRSQVAIASRPKRNKRATKSGKSPRVK